MGPGPVLCLLLVLNTVTNVRIRPALKAAFHREEEGLKEGRNAAMTAPLHISSGRQFNQNESNVDSSNNKYRDRLSDGTLIAIGYPALNPHLHFLILSCAR